MGRIRSGPIRILHVVGGMNRGGTETWLLHVLRHVDRHNFRMDFLVHTTEPCAYDDEIRALGSRVIPCLHPSRPWAYARNLKRILREHGPYGVVHSHVHHYSGYVLRLAEQAGVPVRIAHSHLDTSALRHTGSWLRHRYIRLMERCIDRHATQGLACSPAAGAALVGSQWLRDPRWQLLFCGIDLSAFHAVPDRDEVRGELSIPRDAYVVGHVGRFAEQKNHSFLVEIAAETIRRMPRARFLLVGDGPLRPEIEARVRAMSLSAHIIFAGARADVPRLMLGAMDVFLLPSLYEGLPLVLLEAQAAGLPCVFSDAVAREVEVVHPLLSRRSPSAPASDWADTVLAAKERPMRVASRAALRLVERSPFDIRASAEHLQRLYAQHSES